ARAVEPAGGAGRGAAGAGVERVVGGRRGVAAADRARGLPAARLPQSRRAGGVVPGGGGPRGAAAAGGGGDAAVGVAASTWPDREEGRDAALRPQCLGPPRDRGVTDRRGRRRKSLGGRGLKSSLPARIRGDSFAAQRSKRQFGSCSCLREGEVRGEFQ